MTKDDGDAGPVKAATLFDLTGRVALVTGAAGAIGRSAAATLAANGAFVIASDLDAERLAIAREWLERHAPGRIAAHAADLTEEAAITALFDAAEQAAGMPDIVVNAAGLGLRQGALDMDMADFRRLNAVNVEAAFAVARMAAERLSRAGKPGSIINMSSYLGSKALRNTAAYAATKAAVSQMTRTLALEWARHSIRVNEIVPGWFPSAMTEPFLGGRAGDLLAQTNPMRRLGRPHDLSGALLLLSSDAGAYMTGASITVDGGQGLA